MAPDFVGSNEPICWPSERVRLPPLTGVLSGHGITVVKRLARFVRRGGRRLRGRLILVFLRLCCDGCRRVIVVVIVVSAAAHKGCKGESAPREESCLQEPPSAEDASGNQIIHVALPPWLRFATGTTITGLSSSPGDGAESMFESPPHVKIRVHVMRV